MGIVRVEIEADYPTIRRIHQLAFGRDQEADIVEDMRHRAGAMLSLVAIRRGELVGHAFFSRVIIECASGFDRGVGLAPIAVLPEHQRTGLGTDLIRHAIAAAEEPAARHHGCRGRTGLLSALRLQAGPHLWVALQLRGSRWVSFMASASGHRAGAGRADWCGMRPPSMVR
jgi:GNAT superfamily N-acetyltransferase